MNSSGHAVVGALVGVTSYCRMKDVLQEKPSSKGVAASIAAGMIISGLPDYLEPATSSHHRAFFHSVAALMIPGYIAYRYLRGDELNADAKTILAVVLSSYGSHLALDALTPASLPLV